MWAFLSVLEAFWLHGRSSFCQRKYLFRADAEFAIAASDSKNIQAGVVLWAQKWKVYATEDSSIRDITANTCCCSSYVWFRMVVRFGWSLVANERSSIKASLCVPHSISSSKGKLLIKFSRSFCREAVGRLATWVPTMLVRTCMYCAVALETCFLIFGRWIQGVLSVLWFSAILFLVPLPTIMLW